MFKQVIVLAAFVAITLAYPAPDFDIAEDTEGQQYYLVPLDTEDSTYYNEPSLLARHRRQTTTGGIDNKGFDLSHTQPLINTDRHKLDGTATIGKQWGGPLSTGGGFDYLNKPSRLNAGVTGTHTPGWGTDVSAKAGYNLVQSRDGRTTGGISANYDRHFGGPLGTQRPNYGGFLNFNHRF